MKRRNFSSGDCRGGRTYGEKREIEQSSESKEVTENGKESTRFDTGLFRLFQIGGMLWHGLNGGDPLGRAVRTEKDRMVHNQTALWAPVIPPGESTESQGSYLLGRILIEERNIR